MAEWRDVPLIGQPYESVEEEQLSQWAATVVDFVPIVVEGKLHLMKRPGLEPFLNLGTGLGVDGLHWVDGNNLALAVSGGRVWKITDATGSKQELTGSTALRTSQVVTFATGLESANKRTVLANGAQMVQTDYASLTTMADADAPTAVSHVAFVDGYILANELNTGRVRYSDLSTLSSWLSLSFFTAESQPDDVVAIKEGFREICALGRETVEFWANDGRTPFSRIPGSAQPFGTSAPYSLARIGGTWIWLDHVRRLVVMQGRQVTPVSTPYDRIIQEFSAVDDAVGYTTSISGMPIYLLNFPTARQTLAFNYETSQWHKWGYWDSTQALYHRFRGLSYCYAKAWNLHLFGDHTTGMIYRGARGIYTDNGNPIRSLLRTGHVDHGAQVTKRSHIFRVRCKRGMGNSVVADPKLMYRRRIDNKPKWRNERWKSLGAVGEHEMAIDWRRNGINKTVQHELIHSDASDCVLTGAIEQVEFLGR